MAWEKIFWLMIIWKEIFWPWKWQKKNSGQTEKPRPPWKSNGRSLNVCRIFSVNHIIIIQMYSDNLLWMFSVVLFSVFFHAHVEAYVVSVWICLHTRSIHACMSMYQPSIVIVLNLLNHCLITFLGRPKVKSLNGLEGIESWWEQGTHMVKHKRWG